MFNWLDRWRRGRRDFPYLGRCGDCRHESPGLKGLMSLCVSVSPVTGANRSTHSSVHWAASLLFPTANTRDVCPPALSSLLHLQVEQMYKQLLLRICFNVHSTVIIIILFGHPWCLHVSSPICYQTANASLLPFENTFGSASNCPHPKISIPWMGLTFVKKKEEEETNSWDYLSSRIKSM